MTGVRVVAKVRTSISVIPDEGIPLDGILCDAALRDELGADFYNLPEIRSPEDIVEPTRMPLERRGEGDLWYWSASFGMWDWNKAVVDQSSWTKRFRFDLALQWVDFRGKSQKIDPTSGRFKSYHMPLNYLSTPQIEWYAWGDPGEIERLLSTYCPMIAKKRSVGWGRVEWRVEPFDEDWSTWRGDELMRALPVELVPERLRDRFPVEYRAWQPPYWARPCRECAVPVRPPALSISSGGPRRECEVPE